MALPGLSGVAPPGTRVCSTPKQEMTKAAPLAKERREWRRIDVCGGGIRHPPGSDRYRNAVSFRGTSMSSRIKVLPVEVQCIMGYLELLFISEMTHVTPKGLVSSDNNNEDGGDHGESGAASPDRKCRAEPAAPPWTRRHMAGVLAR